MVFGWGKKKQIIEESTNKITIPTQKEITLENIPDIIHDITNLRQKTLIAEIKSFQNKIESDRNVLLKIADALSNDDLNTDDMDPHLVILVNRGKKEVISSIQNEFRAKFSKIDSFDQVINFQTKSSRGVKKVGDMLGKHTRVIHIFAKKYAKKLKDDLKTLTNTLDEVNSLISNYYSNKELLDDITNSLNDFSSIKLEILKQEKRKSQLELVLNEQHQNQINIKKSIDQMKSSSDYESFQDISEQITTLSNQEKITKKKIEEQFIKISRPLNKYVYVSSLDKPLKIMVKNLAASPYDILSVENKSSIITILNSVQSAIESGSVSVKDVEKSKQAMNEIKSLLPNLIEEKSLFTDKKSKLNNNLSIFDNNELLKLENDLNKSHFNISDTESKISMIQKQIDSNKNSIHGMITKLELNLKQASSVSYKLSYNENDIQN